MKRGSRRFAFVALLFVGLAACGGGEKVGEAFKDFKGGKSGDRIGELAQTPKPKAKPGQKATATSGPAQPNATEAPKQEGLNVKITSAGFDPTAARVFKGSAVTVTNTDASPHTYTSSDATYDSGTLQPGQSKIFDATVTGTFQMEDRTRNWIIGSLEVLAR
jgi:plastocyanin